MMRVLLVLVAAVPALALGQVAPGTCTTPTNANVSVGTGATAVPATALSGRVSVTVCNSPRNTSTTAILTCTDDAVTPTTASSFAGDNIVYGQCLTYKVGSGKTINCISDTSGTRTTVKECK